MSGDWSVGQRRCLEALGFVVYREVGGARPAAPGGADRRLLDAVVRAAGAEPVSLSDAAAWLAQRGVPPVAQLRGDPAAKRALWPRLRALRAGRATP